MPRSETRTSLNTTGWLRVILPLLAVLAPFYEGCTRCSERAIPEDGPVNLLLIVVDTLKAEQLALYGGPTKTPNMEALAYRGVLFENAYSHAPITGPSHASLFTSLHVFEHGVHNNADILKDGPATLASLMAGDRKTAAFISLEALNSKYGVLRGFEEIHEEFPRYWWKTAGEVNDEVLPWMDANAGEPFFLFVHYSDPHGPYTPPSWYQRVELTLNGKPLPPTTMDGRYTVLKPTLKEGRNTLVMRNTGRYPLHLSRWKKDKKIALSFEGPWRKDKNPREPNAGILPPGEAPTLVLDNSGESGEYVIKIKSHFVLTGDEQRAGYAAETAYVDEQIGRLMAKVEALGLAENTVIVLTADHGEELGEHTGKFEHVQHLHECLVHVPLMIAFPDGRYAGQRVKTPVRHIDVLPTLADIFGFPAPGRGSGETLLPPSRIETRSAFFETHRPQSRRDMDGIRRGDHKLVIDKTGKKKSLYNLAADPGEKKNLLDNPNELAAALAEGLEGAMDAVRSGTADTPEPVQADLTEEDKEALKALGYIE